MGISMAAALMEKLVNALIRSKLNRTVVGSEIIIAVGTMITSIFLGSANGPRDHHVGPRWQTTSAIPRSCTPIAAPT
jgi:hypothetical protein